MEKDFSGVQRGCGVHVVLTNGGSKVGIESTELVTGFKKRKKDLTRARNLVGHVFVQILVVQVRRGGLQRGEGFSGKCL